MNTETSLSVELFGALDTDESDGIDLAPSYEQYAVQNADVLQEAEQAVRAQIGKSIDTARKFGEVLTDVKDSLPHGFYMLWLADMKRLFIETNGERGFSISKSTDENYRAVHAVYMHPSGVYKLYKHLGIKFMAEQIAPAIAAGLDPVKHVQYLLAARNADKLLSSGDDAPAVCMDNYRESFPGLYNLYQTGDLSDAMGCDIVEATSAFDFRVVKIIQKHGALNLKAAKALNNVQLSMVQAKREGLQYADILVDIEQLGYLELSSGDQVLPCEATDREIWEAYSNGVKEKGATDAAAKKLFDMTLSREDALELSKRLENETAIEKIERQPDVDFYTLKVTFEPPAVKQVNS